MSSSMDPPPDLHPEVAHQELVRLHVLADGRQWLEHQGTSEKKWLHTAYVPWCLHPIWCMRAVFTGLVVLAMQLPNVGQ